MSVVFEDVQILLSIKPLLMVQFFVVVGSVDENSVVECISDDDVSVAVVGIFRLFSEVTAVDISDVF